MCQRSTQTFTDRINRYVFKEKQTFGKRNRATPAKGCATLPRWILFFKDRRHGMSNSKRIAMLLRHRCRGLSLRNRIDKHFCPNLRSAWQEPLVPTTRSLGTSGQHDKFLGDWTSTAWPKLSGTAGSTQNSADAATWVPTTGSPIPAVSDATLQSASKQRRTTIQLSHWTSIHPRSEGSALRKRKLQRCELQRQL